MSYLRWLTLAFVAFSLTAFAADNRAGYIDHLEVLSTYDAYGGASFGTVGPYVVIVGIAHGKINPQHPANAGITDLALAPRDANGFVDYSEDFVILRPKSAANAKRVLFYDVVNRGNKVAIGTFNGGSGSLSSGNPGNALLLRMGYTIVWSGWQGNLLQTGHGDTASIGTNFPVVTNPDGTTITGQTREEFILDALDASNAPGLKGGVATVTLTYPAVESAGATFNWRQTWLNAQGLQDFNSPSTAVPTANWSFINGGSQLQFTPPAGADLGSIYTFIYTAQNPKVMALGFASVRDLVSFLNHDQKDAQGNRNPLSDLRFAPCENRGCSRNTNFEVTLIEGVSQSGRFVRDFLWQGFNNDARDGGSYLANDENGARSHMVFGGMFPIIPASRKTYTNFRWSQPYRWSKQHEDHFQPGDQFPFAYNVITDPVSGQTDGILRNCLATNTCPKIVQLDGGFEYFGGRATLVSTDGRGHDLTLPDNVRLYVVPGTNHGGGGGVAAISKSPLCQYTSSPVVESTVDRALVPDLEDWVAHGTLPPPSAYPSNAAGDLAPVGDQSAVGFPDLSALGITYPGTLTNQLFPTMYSGGIPSPDLSKPYAILISKTDSDGNELAGVRVPDVAVPLATYTSWNLRAPGHAAGEACFYQGAMFPFATSPATKVPGDPRPSLAERYSSKADYVSKVQAAAQALVQQRLLLPEDVQVYVNAAQAQTILQ